GIPPLMGFYAKFAVLKALISTNAYVWVLPVAVFAVVMSLVGAFYYLRVVKIMYFDDKTDDAPVQGDSTAKLLLSANALLLLLWGVMPEQLMGWIRVAVANAGLTLGS
ncbi:MAG: NADH:ubiquinone oxidoreductase subunit N, partial [Conchiformibius sp.]|nr:NADH:ubiquinone oxidoreductase subunit N [Conchiformibius sp.]